MVNLAIRLQNLRLENHGLHLTRSENRTLLTEDHIFSSVHNDLLVLVDIRYAEAQGHERIVSEVIRTDANRHAVTDAAFADNLEFLRFLALAAILNIGGGMTAGSRSFFGNKVNQIMHVQHVTGSKDTRNIRLQIFADERTIGQRAEFNISTAAELVLRDQTAGEQQRIALIELLGARDRLEAIHLSQRNAFHALFALDIHDVWLSLSGMP